MFSKTREELSKEAVRGRECCPESLKPRATRSSASDGSLGAKDPGIIVQTLPWLKDASMPAYRKRGKASFASSWRSSVPLAFVASQLFLDDQKIMHVKIRLGLVSLVASLLISAGEVEGFSQSKSARSASRRVHCRLIHISASSPFSS
jgi:hypothetical protein